MFEITFLNYNVTRLSSFRNLIEVGHAGLTWGFSNRFMAWQQLIRYLLDYQSFLLIQTNRQHAVEMRTITDF